MTGKDPNVTVNPDEVVALGAAVQVRARRKQGPGGGFAWEWGLPRRPPLPPASPAPLASLLTRPTHLTMPHPATPPVSRPACSRARCRTSCCST
jgi:hypothetical protein